MLGGRFAKSRDRAMPAADRGADLEPIGHRFRGPGVFRRHADAREFGRFRFRAGFKIGNLVGLSAENFRHHAGAVSSLELGDFLERQVHDRIARTGLGERQALDCKPCGIVFGQSRHANPDPPTEPGPMRHRRAAATAGCRPVSRQNLPPHADVRSGRRFARRYFERRCRARRSRRCQLRRSPRDRAL